MAKMVFILNLSFFLNSLFAQTCVIAKKTKNAIYVGAESRETFTKTNLTTKESYDSSGSICKIHNVGKFNFAVLGQEIDVEAAIASKICEHSTTFDEAMELFQKLFSQYLTKYLEFSRVNTPHTYLKIVENNKPVISQTMFFGYESDSSVLAVVLFGVVNPFTEPVQIAHKILHRHLLYGGHVDEIRTVIEKDSTWTFGMVKTIRKLINDEIMAHHYDTGGEITILKVSPNGSILWIPRKNNCIISQTY
jgi:hypothetical protein